MTVQLLTRDWLLGFYGGNGHELHVAFAEFSVEGKPLKIPAFDGMTEIETWTYCAGCYELAHVTTAIYLNRLAKSLPSRL